VVKVKKNAGTLRSTPPIFSLYIVAPPKREG